MGHPLCKQAPNPGFPSWALPIPGLTRSERQEDTKEWETPCCPRAENRYIYFIRECESVLFTQEALMYIRTLLFELAANVNNSFRGVSQFREP